MQPTPHNPKIHHLHVPEAAAQPAARVGASRAKTISRILINVSKMEPWTKLHKTNQAKQFPNDYVPQASTQGNTQTAFQNKTQQPMFEAFHIKNRDQITEERNLIGFNSVLIHTHTTYFSG